ncbi:MAG: hypothetical protein R3208_01465 [Ketobacteraceae bacterium]|nr:hypothetical protein [Ketobacteraceae bacterium]
MRRVGHYVSMAVIALAAAGCGGQKDPGENIKNKTGVVLSVSGIAEFEGTNSQTSVATQQLERVGLFFTNQEKTQSASPALAISKVINVPIDPNDEEAGKYTALQLAPFLEYINNRLSTISFSLNRDPDALEPQYGYDFVVRNPETLEEYWRLSTMLNWCLSLSPEDFSDNFTLVDEYTEPAVLLAAETWRVSDDTRYQSCPITLRSSLITTWSGRPLESTGEEPDKITGIREVVENLIADSEEPPSLSETLQAVLAGADLVEPLQAASAELELVVELTMNEFELLPSPYVFTVTVTEFDFDSLSTE